MPSLTKWKFMFKTLKNSRDPKSSMMFMSLTIRLLRKKSFLTLKKRTLIYTNITNLSKITTTIILA